MLRIALALFFIVHGLIHFGLTTVPGPVAGGPNTPFWPAWWRSDSSSTWLVTVAGLDNAALRLLGALLMLLATLGFVIAGLGLLGVPGLSEMWRPLAVCAALAALPLYVLFWHPWLVVGAFLEIAVIGVFWWAHWPSDALLQG